MTPFSEREWGISIKFDSVVFFDKALLFIIMIF